MNVLEQHLDALRKRGAAQLRFEGGADRAAAAVTEHHEERSLQVHAGVLQRAHDLRGDHVAGHADDEQLAEAGVEDELRRDARVAAAEDGRVRLLSLRQVGKNLFLHGRKARFAAHEPLVPLDEPRQRLISGHGHGR